MRRAYFASAAVSKVKRLSQNSKRCRHESYLDRIIVSLGLIKLEHFFAYFGSGVIFNEGSEGAAFDINYADFFFILLLSSCAPRCFK